MLDIVFKGTKNSHYSYCADQTPIVCIDVVDPMTRVFKKADININVCSLDKKVNLNKSLTRTIFGNCDTLEFTFDDLSVGTYLVKATLKTDDNVISKTIPLTVLEHKLENPTDNYNRRLEVGVKGEQNFVNSYYGEDVPTPSIRNSNEYITKANTNLELTAKSGAYANAKYLYENERYAYIITENDQEVIAYKEDGGYIEVLAGGGNFDIKDEENNTV